MFLEGSRKSRYDFMQIAQLEVIEEEKIVSKLKRADTYGCCAGGNIVSYFCAQQ